MLAVMARCLALALCTFGLLPLLADVALAQHLGHTSSPVDHAWRTVLFQMFWPAAIIVAFLARVTSPARGKPLPSPQARAWMNVDLAALRLGMDVASREFLERELRAIAPSGSAPARDPLEALQRIVRTLRKCDVAWTHGGSSNFHPMSPPVAEAGFKRLVREAQDKSEHATAGTTSGSDPRFALLTLVVAARREVRDFFGGRREEIHALLDDLERLTPTELVSFELVWAPGDAGETMSRAGLDACDSDLAPLAPIGRSEPRRPAVTHCAYCKGPFARTLPTCSHCGAPAPHDG